MNCHTICVCVCVCVCMRVCVCETFTNKNSLIISHSSFPLLSYYFSPSNYLSLFLSWNGNLCNLPPPSLFFSLSVFFIIFLANSSFKIFNCGNLCLLVFIINFLFGCLYDRLNFNAIAAIFTFPLIASGCTASSLFTFSRCWRLGIFSSCDWQFLWLSSLLGFGRWRSFFSIFLVRWFLACLLFSFTFCFIGLGVLTLWRKFAPAGLLSPLRGPEIEK